MPTIGWSNFAINRHHEGAGFSFFKGITYEQVLERVQAAWDKRTPGAGETGLNRKVLVPISPENFYTSTVALQDFLPLQVEVSRRQPHEDPSIEIYLDADDAERLKIEPEAAKHCQIVCYSAEALLENNGERSGDEEWEIVAVLASTTETEPMHPLTMARNFLEKPGGTKSIYTAQEFAEAIYAHSLRGVKIKKFSYPDNMTPDQIKYEVKKLKFFGGRHSGGIKTRQRFDQLEEKCNHKIIKSHDSAYCDYCEKGFGWYCPNSPDHACHYINQWGRTIYLADGTSFEFEINDNLGAGYDEFCVYCGFPDERK